MRKRDRRLVVVAATAAVLASTPLAAQERKYLAPSDQVVAIRAARLFDSRAGTMLNNQVVLIRGDKITDVGGSVQIPAGATVIDLGSATVLPGMIDAHVHVNTGGTTLAQRTLIAVANAQIDLDAGFTTVLDMDSRGGFNTVDLRDAINAGYIQGPRMQVVGQSINQRATNYYPDTQSVRFYEGFTENKNVNSPWLARAAVRENKLHGVDYIKIYTTQDFAGTMHMWKPDATLVNSPSLTYEEVQAIVDEFIGLGSRSPATPTVARAWTAASTPASTPTITCSNLTRKASRFCWRRSCPMCRRSTISSRSKRPICAIPAAAIHA